MTGPVRARISTRGVAAVVGLVCALLAGCSAPGAGAPQPGGDLPAPSPAAASSAARPDVFATGMATPREGEDGLWLAWSVVHRGDERRIGSANAGTERTNAESSMKAWIAADDLRLARASDQGVTARQQDLIERMIRSSDDAAAEEIYRFRGADAVLRHLQPVCGVAVSTTDRGYWSYAQITAEDATNILDCVLDVAPDYPNGNLLVDALHGVDADDAFGIPEALPAGTDVAVKNGWTAHSATGEWNVNCVASWDDYVMAVLTRYPIGRGLDYGAGVCRDVTSAFLAAGG